MAGLEKIQNRVQWASNSHTLHLLQVTFGKICSVKNQNSRDLKLVGLIQPAVETAIGPLWSHAEDTVAVSS